MATGIIKGAVTHTNNMKYNVNIVSYDENNRYIAPCDGYVMGESITSDSAIIVADRALKLSVPSGTYATMFIQKGLNVFGENMYSLYFRAFSEVGG